MLEAAKESARIDALTTLPNRRGWDEALSRELARARREQTPFCIALLDLDHFKAFNDTNGHQAGDRLLRRAASAWKLALRQSDLVARYGGEEFAVLLPICDLDEAMEVIERLRAATPEGQTVSAGVAAVERLRGRGGADRPRRPGALQRQARGPRPHHRRGLNRSEAPLRTLNRDADDAQRSPSAPPRSRPDAARRRGPDHAPETPPPSPRRRRGRGQSRLLPATQSLLNGEPQELRDSAATS